MHACSCSSRHANLKKFQNCIPQLTNCIFKNLNIQYKNCIFKNLNTIKKRLPNLNLSINEVSYGCWIWQFHAILHSRGKIILNNKTKYQYKLDIWLNICLQLLYSIYFQFIYFFQGQNMYFQDKNCIPVFPRNFCIKYRKTVVFDMPVLSPPWWTDSPVDLFERAL